MRLGNIQPIEKKLFHYMDEYKKSLDKQLEMTKEYNDLFAKTKIAVRLAEEWKERANQLEQIAINTKSAMDFNSNIFNRQN